MLRMKKVLCIIYPNFSLYEITTLTSTLALSFDITIDYVASDNSIVISEDGLPCQPTKTLDQIRIEDYSCVILPGMVNIGPALQDEKLISFLRSLDELKKAQEDNNLDEMKAKLEALNEKAQGLAVKLYEQAAAAQQAQAGAEGAQATGNAGDDVVDGEFTEK